LFVVELRRRRRVRRRRWLRWWRWLRRMIEVLDAFEGLFALTKRSGTLDGSIPLRAARACVPLLEGNAFGFQVRLKRALTIERRIGRTPRIHDPRLTQLHTAALPRLLAHGYVGAAFAKAFAHGVVYESRGVLHVFTGLLVRAPPGSVLRVSSTANRRSYAYSVDEVLIDELAPLVLSIRASGNVRLEGELATVAECVEDVAIESVALEEAPDAGRAHVDFYDEAYFAEKKAESTRKYRSFIADVERESSDGPTRVVSAGPVSFAIERRDRFLDSTSALPVRRKGRGISVIAFDALLSFDATFDGSAMVVRYDEQRLAREVKKLERLWTDVFGEDFIAEHRRALWYLTKYFTPHPHGEPHFFVKPWAFVQTPPGWSSLVEGVLGDGYEVMRGVIASDVFHAAPAVFRVHRVGETVRVREGARLLEVIPFPRERHSRIKELAWPDA
jgi:hypothetical protein